jgi:hypothetical protein
MTDNEALDQEHRAMADRLRNPQNTLGTLGTLGTLPSTVSSTDAIRRAVAGLGLARRCNQRNHVRICARFVPDGVSLLRQHPDRARESGSPREEPL